MTIPRPKRESRIDGVVRALVVNDSATMRLALRAALTVAAGIEVVGEASDGAEALALVQRLRPHVVLMDVVMPRVDGWAATREIMAQCPTPIVLVSAVVNARDVSVVMETLRAGALSIVEAPPPPTSPQYLSRCGSLIDMLRAMAAVQVSRARPPSPSDGAPTSAPRPIAGRNAAAIGIAASTGGPGVLVDLLRSVAGETLPPMLIVQHLARGFHDGFARWLDEASGYRTRVAVHGETAERGVAYIAPDDLQLGIDPALRLLVTDDPLVGMFRPSGTHLLRSMARSLGPQARGLVLTGMGDDAADGAVELRRAGGIVAAQDEASCVVYGMPRVTMERGGADVVLSLAELPAWLRATSGAPALPS